MSPNSLQSSLSKDQRTCIANHIGSRENHEWLKSKLNSSQVAQKDLIQESVGSTLLVQHSMLPKARGANCVVAFDLAMFSLVMLLLASPVSTCRFK